MGWVEGPWNTRWKAAQPGSLLAACINTSPLCSIAKICQQCSHDTRRRTRGSACGLPGGCPAQLDWAGLGLSWFAQRSARAYTPVNKLRGGKVAASTARVADNVPSEQLADERRGPDSVSLSVSPCQHQSRAARMQLRGRLAAPVVLLLKRDRETIRLVAERDTTGWISWVTGGLAIGLRLGQKWQMADGLGIALLLGEGVMASP